ncbi:MAG: SDR family NAD(P)-dependent oxidoreductase, partial [Burkholderiales bacterium]
MNAPSGLAGKSALVTGGSRGIGRAIVELFADEGAHVTFFYRGNTGAANDVVTKMRDEGHDVHAEQVDVTDVAACNAAVERLADRAGRIDVLVNNAGVIRDNPLAALDDEDIRTVLDTNVTGVF